MKRGRKLIHIAFFILLTILTIWLSIGLVSAIEESVDGGWNLASGSNADEDMEPEETASPSDAEEDDEEPGTEATPSDATPSEAEPGGDGQDQEEGGSSEELEWDPIPEFEQDEHVVFEMKPLYLDTNASTWNLLKGVNALDQDGNALEVTLAEGEGNFYKASTDYEEARSMSDSADGELATLRKGRYYEVVQAWDAVDECMNKAARIIYVGSPEDFTQDKIPGVATGSDAMLDDMELATGSNALKNVTFEMEPLYLSTTEDVEALDLTKGVRATDQNGVETPVFVVDKGTFVKALPGPGAASFKTAVMGIDEEESETAGTDTENKEATDQTLAEGTYYVTLGAIDGENGGAVLKERTVVVLAENGEEDILSVKYPVSGDVIGYKTTSAMSSDIFARNEIGQYEISILAVCNGNEIFRILSSNKSLITGVTINGSGELKVEQTVCIYYDLSMQGITINGNATISLSDGTERMDISGVIAENVSIYTGTSNVNEININASANSFVIEAGKAGGKMKGVNMSLTSVNSARVSLLGEIDEADISFINGRATFNDSSISPAKTIRFEGVTESEGRFSGSGGTYSVIISDSSFNEVSLLGGSDINVELNGNVEMHRLKGDETTADDNVKVELKEGAKLTINYSIEMKQDTIQMNGNCDLTLNTSRIVNIKNLISIGENNVIKIDMLRNSPIRITAVEGKFIFDTIDGSIPEIPIESIILLVCTSGFSEENFSIRNMPESTIIWINEYGSLMWGRVKINLIYPDQTKSVYDSVRTAITSISSSGQKGIYTIEMFVAEDIDNSTLRASENIEKLVIINKTSDIATFVGTSSSNKLPCNLELHNFTVKGSTAARKLSLNGYDLSLKDCTMPISTLTNKDIPDDPNAISRLILLGGNTISQAVSQGKNPAMEIIIRGEGNTIAAINGVATAEKPVDVIIDTVSPVTIPTITDWGTLTLNEGSALTVTGDSNGDKVCYSKNATLSLLGTTYINSIAVDGPGNVLKVKPNTSSAMVYIKGDGMTGSEKLKLSPAEGNTVTTLGAKLIYFEKRNAKASDFEEAFDESNDLFIDNDALGSNIVLSGPLENIRLSYGNFIKAKSSLKSAFKEIGAGTDSYMITFLKPNYTISSEDIEALKTYGSDADSIVYTGTYTLTKDDILQTGESVGQTVTRTIYIDNDIEFPSKTVIHGIDIVFNKENCGIYAGGSDLTIGQNVIFVGANIPNLYGGSGSNNVTATSMSVENGTYHSIYGGGNGTDVTMGTSVTIAENVTVEALSGGSAGGGSISGKRQINLAGTNSFDSIVDFDELNLGSSSAGADITVDGTLDSDSGLAAGEARTGVIHFGGGSTLTLSGNGGAVLAAGTLKNDSSQNNRLLLTKTSSGVNGLTIAKCVNEAVGTPLKLGLTSGSEAAEIMDPLLILTNRSAVSANSFKLDGLSFNLFISKGTGNGGSLCLGLEAEPGGELLKVVHQLADGTVTAPEDATAKPGKKVFLQLYDIDMTDPDGAGAGLDTDTIYIDSSSALSQSWMTDDLIPATGAVVEIDDPEGDGKHTWTGSAVIDEVEASKVYYVHLKDKMGNYAIFPIDTLGPGRNGDIETAAVNGGFSIKLKLSDPSKNSQSGIAYKAGGISQAGWSSTEKDTEALLEDFSLSTLSGIQKVNPAAGTYDYQFKVTAADMNGNTSMIIYVYVKDSYGNTSKIAVPVSQYIMNVSVPSKVGVVAVKGGEAPKLLTPDCYITNQGFFPIKISVETFTHRSATASNAIKVVDKSGGFGEDEINLKLLPLSGSATFAETPVAGIGEAAPLELGTIPGAGSAGNKLGFKFGADFDQYTLKELTGWEPFVMSYKLELAVQQ